MHESMIDRSTPHKKRRTYRWQAMVLTSCAFWMLGWFSGKYVGSKESTTELARVQDGFEKACQEHSLFLINDKLATCKLVPDRPAMEHTE